MHRKFWSENLKGEDILQEDLGTDVKINLKQTWQNM
jgi:hypothetical protein